MVVLMKPWMHDFTKFFLIAIKKYMTVVIDWPLTIQKWGIPVIPCENFVGTLTTLNDRDMSGHFF
jgi:hypothetical protein